MAALLLGVGGSCQLKGVLARRPFVRASHVARAEVRQRREIVPGAGHVFFYLRLKIKPYAGTHNRSYTQLLRVRHVADLPLGQPVILPDSALAISGFVALDWPHDMTGITGTVTRLSADTPNPKLDVRLQYTVRAERRTLHQRLVFRADTAYFRPKK